MEAGGDLDHVEGPHPGRGELDGERQAVEAEADVGDGVDRRAIVEGEAGRRGGGPLGEELGGVVLRQRRDRVEDLAGHAEALPAGGEHPDTRAGGDQVGGGVGRLVDDVLAVVEDEQGSPFAEGGGQVGGRRGVGQGAHRRRLEAQRVADRREDTLAGGDARQVDHPHRFLRRVGPGEADFHSEAGLAGAAGADEGDEAVRRQQLVDGFQLDVAADAAGQRPGQVASREGRRCGSVRPGQRRILGQDGRLQPAQLGAGLDPELVGQDRPGLLEGPQRLGLPLAAVQGHHELAPEPLSEGVGLDEGPQGLGTLGVAPEGQVGLDGVLGHGQPQLAQAGPLAGGELVEGEVGQRLAPPQAERLVEEGRGVGGRPGLEERPPFGDQALDARRASTSSGPTSSRYPGARVTMAPEDLSARRRRDTCSCRALPARWGCSSP